MELGGAKLGEKVTVMLTDNTRVVGDLLEIKTFGLELGVIAYKKTDHKRFFPFSNIKHVEKYVEINLGVMP